jgi:hypothetical protein
MIFSLREICKRELGARAELSCCDIEGIIMRALQVSIDGRIFGVFCVPDEAPLLAMCGNIPRTYMRAHIMTGTDTESWQWQMPDVQEGECIEFLITEAEPESSCPPHFVRRLESAEISNGESRINDSGSCDNEST